MDGVVKDPLNLIIMLQIAYCLQDGEDVGEFAKGKCGESLATNQPWLFVRDDDDEMQFFIVVDKEIFSELPTSDYFTAVLTLIGVYYSFNIEYKGSQKLVFRFLEDYLLGLSPKKASKKYNEFVNRFLLA